MRTWTFSEIKTKVETDLDLSNEDFVSDDEMLGYANDGIDECEAAIHNLNEDYFLTSDTLAVTEGVSDYAMPTDIYGNKIRAVHYDNGTLKYEIGRIKLKDIPLVDTQDAYRYLLRNTLADGPQMRFYPAPREDDATSITRFYLRNANRLTDSNSVCDIPEFTGFVINYMKVQVAVKEGHPRLDFFREELEKSRGMLQATLNEMVPDGDNSIELDLSLYVEHS